MNMSCTYGVIWTRDQKCALICSAVDVIKSGPPEVGQHRSQKHSYGVFLVCIYPVNEVIITSGKCFSLHIACELIKAADQLNRTVASKHNVNHLKPPRCKVSTVVLADWCFLMTRFHWFLTVEMTDCLAHLDESRSLRTSYSRSSRKSIFSRCVHQLSDRTSDDINGEWVITRSD